MNSAKHLPEEVRKSFGFKLTVYILPGIIFTMIAALLIIPAPKPKQGILQGRVSATSTLATLIAEPVGGTGSSTEIVLTPGADYKLVIPAGEYQLKLKETEYSSPQLPRTLTVAPNTSAIFDITIE